MKSFPAVPAPYARSGRLLWGGICASMWRDGELIDLVSRIAPRSGWDYLDWARAINNAGLIGGYGRLDGQRRGFLLIPILSPHPIAKSGE